MDHEQIVRLLDALLKGVPRINHRLDHDDGYADSSEFAEWATRAKNILRNAFGPDSAHCLHFEKLHQPASVRCSEERLEALTGVIAAARADLAEGFLFSLERTIAGEVFVDFVALAKRCLSEGSKDVAAVLACAALEDALKRYAMANNLDVDGKSMQDVVNALKSKGLVTGAKRGLLDAMPKIRDSAMHADWAKIQKADVNGVIGFVEQFLLEHF